MASLRRLRYQWTHVAACACALGAASPQAAAVLPDTAAVTGARITETVTRVYYVNQRHAAANDANAGVSESSPLKTIGAGLTKALADVRGGTPTKVRIYPGVYREGAGWFDFGSGAGKTTLLVIEGTVPDSVIISGADLFTGWTPYRSGIYEHAWPHDFGNGFYDYEADLIAHRSELVAVNGRMLKQKVLENYSKSGNVFDTYTGFTPPENVLTPGTYGVAERDVNGNKLYLCPPSGTDMATAAIEVAVRHTFMTMSAKDNLVLRNLTFRHFANRKVFPWSDEGVITVYGAVTNALIENCASVWNNNIGAPIATGKFSQATQRNCRYEFNGFAGGGIDGANIVVQDCRTSFNCWRGFWGNHTGWDVAGMKYHESQGLILRRHEAIGNLTIGIWYDVHCKNVVVDGLTAALNLGHGLFTEISYGPFLVTRSLFALNGASDIMYYTVGHITYRDNIVYRALNAAEEAAMKFFWYPRPGNGHWEIDPFHPGGLALTGNVITAAAGAADPLMGFYGNPLETPQFHTIYQGSGNRWYHYSGSSAGKFLCGWNWTPDAVDFNGWCAFWGAQEQGAAWGDPGFAGVANLDFRLAQGSPLRPREAELPCRAVDAARLDVAREFFAWAGYDCQVPQGTTRIGEGGRTLYPRSGALPPSRLNALWACDLRGRVVRECYPSGTGAGQRVLVIAAGHGGTNTKHTRVR